MIYLSFAAKRIAAAYSIMAYPKQFSYCKSSCGILLCEGLLQVSPVRIWGMAFCRVLFDPFSNHLSSSLIPSSHKRTLYCLAELVWKKHHSDYIHTEALRRYFLKFDSVRRAIPVMCSTWNIIPL